MVDIPCEADEAEEADGGASREMHFLLWVGGVRVSVFEVS